ncbi:MAG: hypothetical protein U0519_04295 [Candidatus Gracilibacteria bacterium]
MADGDNTNNQGQQQKTDKPLDAQNGAADQKKAERAAKERERRRRRRRKKAQLKRLERETLAGGGEKLPKAEASVPAEVSPTPKMKKIAPVPTPEIVQKLPAQLPKEERHGPQRSDEHTPRSKAHEPHVPKTEKTEKQPVESEHPLGQKTHSFAGPLLQQPEQQQPESPQPVGEPGRSDDHITEEDEGLNPEDIQIFEPETPEDSGVSGAAPNDQLGDDEPGVEPPVEVSPVTSEPAAQPVQDISEPKEPEISLSQSEPESAPAPELAPAPSQHQEESELAAMPSEPVQPLDSSKPPEIQPPEDAHQDEDIVIHSDRDEHRPSVGMEQVIKEDDVHEPSSIFPYPPHDDVHENIEDKPQEVQPEPVKAEKKPSGQEKHHEKHESSKESLPESEGLHVRTSFLQGAGAFSAGVLKKLGEALHGLKLKFSFQKLGLFLLMVVLGGGLYAGYLLKVHEKVYETVTGWFKAPPPVAVNIDEKLLREWGITTALLFGDNRGANQDLLASQLYNAYYFGHLAEPRIEGETGVSAAYIYGTGADLVAETNLFIEYVKNLRELVSAYDVDVYSMLDATTNRTEVLDKYLAQLKAVLEKSNKYFQEINVLIDDTKASYESLNPERTRFETDFFAALQGLAGEKADFLLKSFVDVSQKQTALKARVAALQKLAGYYESSMKKIEIRIKAIEKNHEALAQGIRVVDIPGANLDIIIKETP